MKRFIVLLIGLMPFALNAQLELGAMVGVSTYKGDVSPGSIWKSFGQSHAAYGGFVRYNVNNFIAAKFNVYHGKISGDDAESTIEERRVRNLNFRSNILEFGLNVEYNILGYQAYNLERVFSPYVFAGVALYRYNPEAFFDNRWIELQPQGTEGQGLASLPEREFYSLTNVSIPFGVGVKYAINDKWNLGLEIGARASLTDYLDDVSTTYVDQAELMAARGETAVALSNRSGLAVEPGDGRGDPTEDDWYFIIGLTISYNFADNGLVGSRGKNRRRQGCQTF